jgi:hypothetical protein
MDRNFTTVLEVNGGCVELNRFAGQFLALTVLGAVSSLKGGEDVRDLELALKKGGVTITVNGSDLPLTPFPEEIIANTITGLVSSLKGIGKIDSLKIKIRGQETTPNRD